MKLFGADIGLSDFIPPIITRTIRYLRKTARKDGEIRLHPFDCVPRDLKVKWILDVGANRGGCGYSWLKYLSREQGDLF